MARLGRITFEDLVDVPLVLTDHSTSIRAIVESAFAVARLRPVVACETTHMITAAAIVASGLGVAILPGRARERAFLPNLCSRPIDGDAFVRPIALVKKPRRTLSAACESFALACMAAMESEAPAHSATSGCKDKR